MPDITVTVPTSVSAELTTIMQKELSDENGDPSTLTSRALLTAWLRQQFKSRLGAVRRTANVDLSAEETARTDAEAALATENAARITAENTEDASAVTDLGGLV